MRYIICLIFYFFTTIQLNNICINKCYFNTNKKFVNFLFSHKKTTLLKNKHNLCLFLNNPIHFILKNQSIKKNNITLVVNKNNDDSSYIDNEEIPDIRFSETFRRLRNSQRAGLESKHSSKDITTPDPSESVDEKALKNLIEENQPSIEQQTKREEEEKHKSDEQKWLEEEKKWKQEQLRIKETEGQLRSIEQELLKKHLKEKLRISWKDAPLFSMEDAVARCLEVMPALKRSEMRVEVQKGICQRKTAPFDVYISGNASTTLQQKLQDPFNNFYSNITSHENNLSLNISKKTRLGTTFILFGTTNQVLGTLYPIFGPRPAPFGGFRQVNRANLSFSIFQPLLRDFINSQDTIQEKVDLVSLKSVYYDYLSSVEGYLTNVMHKYWDLYAARLHQLERIKALIRYRYFIKKWDSFHSEESWAINYRKEMDSKLKYREFMVEQTNHDVNFATQELNLAIGMRDSLCDPISTLEDFSMESFPPIPEDLDDLISSQQETFYQLALENRYDILAMDTRHQVAELLLKGASNLSLPRFDIFFSQNLFNYSIGENADRLASALENVYKKKYGPNQSNTTIGLSFSIPFSNPDGKGYVRQRKAELAQSLYSKQRKQEEVYKDISVTIARVKHLMSGLRAEETSIPIFEEIRDSYSALRNISDTAAYIGYDERVTDLMITRNYRIHNLLTTLISLQQTSGTIMCPDHQLDFGVEPTHAAQEGY